MKNLLYITANPISVENSFSLSVGETFLSEYKKINPKDNIQILDLFETEIPSYNKEMLKGYTLLHDGDDISHLSSDTKRKFEITEKLLNQFINSDKIVFINPIWTYFLPPVLKTYIDHIFVVGKTVLFSEHGPVGLLENKKVLHIQSCAGLHNTLEHGSDDFGSPYLKKIMSVIGISDFNSIFIEGIHVYPDKKQEILNNAKSEAIKIAQSF